MLAQHRCRSSAVELLDRNSGRSAAHAYGHTVVPRVKTVLSQTIVPMVIPWNVARVPNFKFTSVSLPVIADPFGGFRRLLLRFRRPEPLPRSIVLRHIQRLQRCPGPDRLLSCGALLRSHEVAHEVDVSPVGNLRKWPCSLTQSNVFSYQISVGDLDTIGDLIFPPTIEPVARAGLSLQTRRESESLSLEKVLGFLVVGVDDDSKVETQPSFDVSHS